MSQTNFKILVIEDDKEINNLICEYLATVGYEMLSATNGLTGLKMLEEQSDIDLCLLDLMLPMKSGDMILKKLREDENTVPVIVLSAKDTIQTKIDLFKLGADDYLTKPFDLDELLMRVMAVLNRCQYRKQVDNLTGSQAESKTLTYKNMVLNDETKTVTVCEKKLDLTAKEYAILKLMLENPKKLFSKANLFESVWQETYYAEDNVMKVHMSNLRLKIKRCDDQEYIETVWGMGYKLAE